VKLEDDTGVGTDDVEDSSDPAASSWGLDAVGVVDEDVLCMAEPEAADEKLRNIARMESALGFLTGLPFCCSNRLGRRLASSSITVCPPPTRARDVSRLDMESLPWLLLVLCGDRPSVAGEGGVLFERGRPDSCGWRVWFPSTCNDTYKILKSICMN
jgi:hypothetical protein